MHFEYIEVDCTPQKHAPSQNLKMSSFYTKPNNYPLEVFGIFTLILRRNRLKVRRHHQWMA